jgi:hypothetical protein
MDDRVTENQPLETTVKDLDVIEKYIRETTGPFPADNPPTILIVPTAKPLQNKPSRDFLASLQKMLKQLGYRIRLADDPGGAAENLTRIRPVTIQGERNFEIVVHDASLTPEQRAQIKIQPTLKSLNDLQPEQEGLNVIIISGENNDVFLKDLVLAGREGRLEGKVIALVSCGVDTHRLELIKEILESWGATAVLVYRGRIDAESVNAMIEKFQALAEEVPEQELEQALEEAVDKIIDEQIVPDGFPERLRESEFHVELLVNDDTMA